MTTAAATNSSDRAGGAPTRRVPIDVIGLTALAIAAAGLAATIVLTRAPASQPAASPSVAAAVAPFTPPARDQWYLAARVADPGAVVQSGGSEARDKWYLEGARSVTVRDTWYLDRAQVRPAAPAFAPIRDRWYLEARFAPDVPKDRWYRE